MIKDSGERRSFSSGAVRDIAEGKGRCDLLPLREVAELLESRVIELLAAYVDSGLEEYLYDTICVFLENNSGEGSLEEMILDLSKHFEAGCLKYGEPKPETGYLSNWQLGIPLHCYIDSGVRHYLKHLAGHTDERHDLAFVWNMLCCVWTQRNRPEMIDLPFAGKVDKAAASEMDDPVQRAGDACKNIARTALCFTCPVEDYAMATGCKTCKEYIEQNPLRVLDMIGGVV